MTGLIKRPTSAVSKLIVFIAITQSLVVPSAFTQSKKIGTPVKWERYSIGGPNVSILLPKMPVRINYSNPCDEMQTSQFWAYADNMAYVLRIVSKLKANRDHCSNKRNFGRTLFDEQIKSIASGPDVEMGQTRVGDRQSVQTIVYGKSKTYLFDEIERDRWFELTIVRRTPNPELESKFVSSLVVDDNTSGISITSGSPETLGDEYEPPIPSPSESKPASTAPLTGKGNGAGDGVTVDEASKLIKPGTSLPIVIAVKPKPLYTDVARQHLTQGTVILRVTFLANGGIGSVSVLKALENGLTEQAIAAARKIMFLPMQFNSINITVTKQIEYTFSIY